MMKLVLTCERCGREASDESWEGSTTTIDVQKYLERMKYQDVVIHPHRWHQQESILLCPDCLEKYCKISDKWDNEREVEVTNFLKNKEG